MWDATGEGVGVMVWLTTNLQDARRGSCTSSNTGRDATQFNQRSLWCGSTNSGVFSPCMKKGGLRLEIA